MRIAALDALGATTKVVPSITAPFQAWQPRSEAAVFPLPPSPSINRLPAFCASGRPCFCPGWKGPLHVRCVWALGFGRFKELLSCSAQPVLLMDVPAVAQALGFSIHQARRFLAAPAADSPAPLGIAARIFVRRPQLEAWERANWSLCLRPISSHERRYPPRQRGRLQPRKSLSLPEEALNTTELRCHHFY